MFISPKCGKLRKAYNFGRTLSGSRDWMIFLKNPNSLWPHGWYSPWNSPGSAKCSQLFSLKRSYPHLLQPTASLETYLCGWSLNSHELYVSSAWHAWAFQKHLFLLLSDHQVDWACWHQYHEPVWYTVEYQGNQGSPRILWDQEPRADIALRYKSEGESLLIFSITWYRK